jgi:hypothetical protein
MSRLRRSTSERTRSKRETSFQAGAGMKYA